MGSNIKPDVLAACARPAVDVVRRILDAYVTLLPVNSLTAAQYELAVNRTLALILCGVHFDESRMYDLRVFARHAYPRIPFVSCRILNTEIPRISRDAIALSPAFGDSIFLDLPALIEQFGNEEGERRFRESVLAQAPVRED